MRLPRDAQERPQRTLIAKVSNQRPLGAAHNLLSGRKKLTRGALRTPKGLPRDVEERPQRTLIAKVSNQRPLGAVHYRFLIPKASPEDPHGGSPEKQCTVIHVNTG